VCTAYVKASLIYCPSCKMNLALAAKGPWHSSERILLTVNSTTTPVCVF